MRRLVGTVAVVVLASTSLGQAQRASTDVTQWRGPNRDGVVQGFTAPQAWPETLVKRWTVEVGTGYATPLVVGNRVFVFSRLGENETMTALDGDSGKVVWQQSYPAPFAMNPATKAHGPGPKSTPVLLRRPALFDRHDRRCHGLGRRQWQAGVAEAGDRSGHGVHEPLVLAAG